MNFEKFLFNTEAPKTEPTHDVSEEIDVTKRRLLQGGGALAAAAALGIGEAEAHHSSEIVPSFTDEEKINNIVALDEWGKRLQAGRGVLEDPTSSYKEVMDIIRPNCRLDRQMFEGTAWDPEDWFRNGLTDNSWPAVQLRTVTPFEGEPEEKIRWAHDEPSTEFARKVTFGNAAFVDNVLISASHITELRYNAETLGEDYDIAGISLTELTPNRTALESVERTAFESDRQNASYDMHGEFGFILSIHDYRGASEADNTDMTPTVFIKMNKGLIDTLGIPTVARRRTGPGPEDFVDVSILEELEHSYMGIVASRDVNLDHEENIADISGISGSPVITYGHVAEMKKSLDGVVILASSIADTVAGQKYDVVFVHGPDAVVEIQDKVNTIISQDLSGEEIPAKYILTRHVQKVLFDYGYKDMKIDGDYGDYTRRVVEDFQKRVFTEEVLRKSVIPGVVDRLTWGKLFPRLAGVNKEKLYEAMKE